MSSHLARPSSTRPSQDPAQRRLRRLSFRPLAEAVVAAKAVEAAVEPTGGDEQTTLKVPAVTLHYVKRRREFLVAPKRPQWKEQQENNTQPAPLDKIDVEERPTKKVPASSEDNRSQVEHAQTVPMAVPEQQNGLQLDSPDASQPDTLVLDSPDASQPDTLVLDSLDASQPDTLTLVSFDASQPDTVTLEKTTAGIDGDSELGRRPTIPMMVLTGIASQQGKPQPEMNSEVSGAASAASLMGFGNIIGNILKYIGAFLIQYGFGAGGYGLYTLCLSMVNLISALFNLGLDDAMVRYVAIYRGKQQTKSLRGLLIFCTTLAGLAGIAGALLLLFFSPPLVTYWISLKQHHVANRDTLVRAIALLQVMAPLIPLMTMQVMWFAGLRGFRAFKWRVLTTGIIQPSLQILLLGLVLIFFRTKDGITAVAVALFISTMFNTVLNLYFLFREVERVVTPEPEHYEVREWLTFASFNFLTTIIDTVLDSIDTILLARFGLSDVAIGQYGAAIRLGNFIAMPLLSINNVFAPTIAELHSKGEMQKLESMFKLLTKWTVMFSLPIFLVMVLFAPYLLALPGPSFVAAWPLLIAFSIGSMINAGTGAVGYMLLMTGYQRLSFLNSLVAVVFNIGLGIILTPRYGAMGTAISTGLAICVLNFMRVLQVRLVLKMHPYNREVLKPVAAGVISAAPIGGILYLLSAGHVHAALHLGHAIVSVQLLLIPVFFVGYIVLITRFKASPEDEFVLKGLRKKFLGGNKNRKKMKER